MVQLFTLWPQRMMSSLSNKVVIGSIENMSGSFNLIRDIQPSRDPEYHFLKIAFNNSRKNAGFIAFNQKLDKTDGYLAGTYVAPEYRNKGLFTSMLYVCLEYFKNEKQTEIFQRTATIRKPQLALLLEKVGYVPYFRNGLVKVTSPLGEEKVKILPISLEVENSQYAENGKRFYEIDSDPGADTEYPVACINTAYGLEHTRNFLKYCLKGRSTTNMKLY